MLEMTDRKNMEVRLRYLEKMESLGLLVGGVAHNFNDILQPIMGYSNLLLEKVEASSEEYEHLATIVDSVRRAKEIVAQLMTFTRRSQATKRVHDLATVVREATKLIRSMLPTSTTLREDISWELTPVFCDATQIHQVVMNLCVNAHQAITDTGEIKITLQTVTLEKQVCHDGTSLSGKHVQLSVTDNGLGMEKDTLPDIFKPMFTTKAAGNGSGFGLSTVLDIVTTHGGGINVLTECGEGSAFEVFLPLSDTGVEEIPRPRDKVRDRGTEKILFVDDVPAIRRLGKSILENDGYKLTIASDGHQALQIFENNPQYFDLVITDQTMPNLTGETLKNKLRKIRPDIAVILSSGRRDLDSSEDDDIEGISAFLDKPFTPSQLRRTVREILDRSNKPSSF